MSKAKHTPGPWAFIVRPTEVAGVEVAFDVWSLAETQAGHGIASGQSQEHLDDYGIHAAECEANARLIAAAPTMLEALQNLENDDGAIPGHAWDMVQKAIQQATGATA